jgi:hypothetical protein
MLVGETSILIRPISTGKRSMPRQLESFLVKGFKDSRQLA